MRISLFSRTQLVSGLLLLAVGGLAGIGAAGYPVGTVARMGPGFLPLVLSVLLMIVGAALLLNGLRGSDEGERPVHWDQVWLGLRPLLFSAVGLAQFAFTINIIGLPLSTAALVFIISFAEREFSLRQRLITAAAIATGVYVIFGVVLNLPINMWP